MTMTEPKPVYYTATSLNLPLTPLTSPIHNPVCQTCQYSTRTYKPGKDKTRFAPIVTTTCTLTDYTVSAHQSACPLYALRYQRAPTS